MRRACVHFPSNTRICHDRNKHDLGEEQWIYFTMDKNIRCSETNYYYLLILKLVEHAKLTTQFYEYIMLRKEGAWKTVPRREDPRPDENQLL